MFTLKNVFVIFAISTNCVFSKDLPEYLKNLTCSKSQKDFEDCFVRNGNKAIPLVVRGDPDYNIPKLNPMEISSVELISTPNLSVNLTNVKIRGLENMKLQKAKLLIEKSRYTHWLKGENIIVEGEYEANGQVMIMPIKGKGHFTTNLKNGIYEVTSITETYEKDGELHLKIVRSSIKYSFERITFNFENLFDGNKELGDKVNEFLNENWDILLVDFGPGISDTILKIYRSIFDAICLQIPMKYFF
ncbi:hypothetical protein WA026_005440 [Henosepilachna vigintioctopunctata]|uniref:Protein takeout-like n=1 Tax=Henosepilachna vigintioctopunctata TaxID=420089 RepID=A0AAW1TUZ2_9CUCU